MSKNLKLINLAPEVIKDLNDCKKAPIWHPKSEIAPNKCEIITKLLKGANFTNFMKV